MKYCYSALLILTCLLLSCSSRPEDLIVGEWKFDHVEAPPNKNDPSILDNISSVNETFSGVTTEFFEDGTCMSRFPGEPEPIKGIYRFEDNKGTLITSYEASPKENPSKILRLNSSELVLETDFYVYYMTK